MRGEFNLMEELGVNTLRQLQILRRMAGQETAKFGCLLHMETFIWKFWENEIKHPKMPGQLGVTFQFGGFAVVKNSMQKHGKWANHWTRCTTRCSTHGSFF
jgi:hypothetical protein